MARTLQINSAEANRRDASMEVIYEPFRHRRKIIAFDLCKLNRPIWPAGFDLPVTGGNAFTLKNGCRDQFKVGER